MFKCAAKTDLSSTKISVLESPESKTQIPDPPPKTKYQQTTNTPKKKNPPQQNILDQQKKNTPQKMNPNLNNRKPKPQPLQPNHAQKALAYSKTPELPILLRELSQACLPCYSGVADKQAEGTSWEVWEISVFAGFWSQLPIYKGLRPGIWCWSVCTRGAQ